MAIKGHTALSPDDLLGFLKRIEQRMGRQPTVRYGPQPIHPDILFADVTRGCLDFGSKPPPGAERMGEAQAPTRWPAEPGRPAARPVNKTARKAADKTGSGVYTRSG